jgi:uncharacterized membrane protein
MVNPEHINYIKELLSQGKTKEDIYKDLLSKGWKVDEIERYFKIAAEESGEGKSKKETEISEILSEQKQSEDTQKRTINIILTIGAVLVGAGIFSFIAANWSQMAKFTKVFIIVAAMLFSYFLGWYFEEKKHLLRTGRALILLGTIIYGAGIFLTAQIFNIRANWPDGLILWMIGVMAIAYARQIYGLFYFAIVLGAIAIFKYPLEILNIFKPESFLFTSSFLLLTATVITFLAGRMFWQKTSTQERDYY